MKADEVLRWLLAWAMMCCAQKPPLYPAMTGVLMLTALRKVCTMRLYKKVLRCSDECIRVHVHRLMRLGLLESRRKDNKQNTTKLYTLTPQGMRMVYAWVSMTTHYYGEL